MTFDYFPALAEDSEVGRRRRFLMELFLFGQQKRDALGAYFQMVPKYVIAIGLDLHPESFSTEEIVDDYQRNVHPVNLTGWSWEDGLCRCARPEVPIDLIRARRQDAGAHFTKKTGYVDGASWSERRRRKFLADQVAGEKAAAEEAAVEHPAADLIRFLNNQDGRNFSGVWQRSRSAVLEAIDGIPSGSPDWDYCDRIRAAVDEQPQPIYHPSERTSRIFDHGMGWHAFPSAVRKVALSGLHTLDLCCSQLAIVSTLWDIPSIHGLLSSRQSIWPVLIADLGLDPSAKPALKDAVYAACYGGAVTGTKTRAGILDTLTIEIGQAPARAFIDHPLIVDVLDARRREQVAVAERGGLTDAFGRMIHLGSGVQAHHALAQHIQSVELQIMLAGFDVIRRTPDLRILSWLHDGMTLMSIRSRQESRQIRAVVRAINAEAQRLGVPTWIEE